MRLNYFNRCAIQMERERDISKDILGSKVTLSIKEV